MAKSAKAQEARRALSLASRKAKVLIEIHAAKTGETLTVNEMLMRGHRIDTRQDDFRTFATWKKDGYKVKKGSTGFRIWGKPVKAKKEAEIQGAEEKEFSMFPMCVLFHTGQVELMQSTPDIDAIDPIAQVTAEIAALEHEARETQVSASDEETRELFSTLTVARISLDKLTAEQQAYTQQSDIAA